MTRSDERGACSLGDGPESQGGSALAVVGLGEPCGSVGILLDTEALKLFVFQHGGSDDLHSFSAATMSAGQIVEQLADSVAKSV